MRPAPELGRASRGALGQALLSDGTGKVGRPAAGGGQPTLSFAAAGVLAGHPLTP